MERRTERIGVPAYQGQEEVCMKRSEINKALKELEAMCRQEHCYLPPFCNFTPEQWQSVGHEYDEVRDCMLGWDITDYGLGDFDKVGFSLITIRNGNRAMQDKYPKVYAEKLLYMKEGQYSPNHFHWYKTEDIINRGGGNVLIRVYNSLPDESIDKVSDVTVHCDGRTYTVDVTDQKVQNLIDLLGAGKVTGKDKDHPQVALTFTHKLVKIALDIQAGNGLDNTALAGTGITLTGQRTNALYDVVAGGEVVIPEEGEETGIELLTAADGTAAEAIVLPVGDTEGMYLVFDIPDVGTFNWRVKDAPKSQSFEAGKKYIYTITVNRMSVEVESSVTDWQPGNGEGETGSAE